MGPGVFRANPNLLNHPNYVTLIDNVIRFTTIDALTGKESPFYHKLMSNFIDKLNVQEEIVSLEIVREQYKWKINDRIADLEVKLADIKNSEINIDILLDMKLDELFEVKFSEMRTHTQLFQSNLNKQKSNIKQNLPNKLEELKECIYVDEEQVEYIEFEIEKLMTRICKDNQFSTKTTPS